MPRQRRHKTRYSGVFVVDLSSGDQTFYIRFKKGGKLIEERAGRKKQGMTGAKANQLRADRMTGKSETNAEKRARLLSQAGRLRISGIWKEYLRNKGDKLKGLRTDENRYRNHIAKTFGRKFPDDLVPLDIDRLESTIAKTHTVKTVGNVLELLRRIINFGMAKQLCPLLTFKIRIPSVDNKRIEVLTDEQFSNLNNVWDEYPDQHIINMHRLIAWTGMRPSEPC